MLVFQSMWKSCAKIPPTLFQTKNTAWIYERGEPIVDGGIDTPMHVNPDTGFSTLPNNAFARSETNFFQPLVSFVDLPPLTLVTPCFGFQPLLLHNFNIRLYFYYFFIHVVKDPTKYPFTLWHGLVVCVYPVIQKLCNK